MKTVDEKFNPDNLFLIKLPPLRNTSNNEMSNEEINQVEAKIEEYSKNHGKIHMTVLPINDTMLFLPDKNSLLYDDIILAIARL